MSLDTPLVPELSAQQRHCNLVLLLFTPTTPLHLTTIGRINRVLPAQAEQDIHSIGQEIMRFHALRVVYHPKQGYRLQGSAYDQRLCMLHWLRRAQRLLPNSIETIFIPRINEKSPAPPSAHFLQQIDDILEQAESTLHRTFGEQPRELIQYFLRYCRYQRQTLSLPSFPQHLKYWLHEKEEYRIAERLCQATHGSLPMGIHELESEFTTLFLTLIKTYRYLPEMHSEDRHLMDETELAIQQIEKLTQITFNHREQFCTQLFAHMGPAIERCLFGIKIGNPLLEEIETRYPGLMSMTQKAVQRIEQNYQIHFPPEELCLIAVSFGAWLMQEGVLAER